MKYRLIAIDLDGTLVNKEGDISHCSKEAIQRALDRGMKVTLATGRMYQPSARYAKELGLSTPVICYQGALVRELESEKTLWHKPLPVPISRQVMERVRQTDLHLYVYVDDALYVEEITERGQWYASRNGVELNLVADLAAFLKKEPTEIVAWGEPENIDHLVPRLNAEFGKDLLVTKSYPSFCEIGHPESGKGNALKYLAELLGIEQCQTVAIGDGPNDVSMLEWAGLSIVLGTAPPEVIAVADWVVENNSEDSLARAIEKLLQT